MLPRDYEDPPHLLISPKVKRVLNEELTPLYLKVVKRFLLTELSHIDSDLLDECVAAVYHAAREQVEDDRELAAVTRQVHHELRSFIGLIGKVSRGR